MARAPRIACVGLASWDRLIVVDRYPDAGGYAIVQAEHSLPGGTTSNTAAALARIGAEVRLRAMVGDDADGAAMVAEMAAIGVNTEWLETRCGEGTDRATVIISTEPPDRTIYWHQGARIVRGDRIDITALFGHDVIVLDMDDAPLRRFLVDLPAHTLPTTKLLGALTYLTDGDLPDAFEIAMRHDVIVGNERELMAVTDRPDLDSALARVRDAMPGNNLRGCVVSRGAAGACAITRDVRWDSPALEIAVVDTTGAGDAFAAGVAYGMARRWDWSKTLRVANAMGGAATMAVGGQGSLATLNEVAAMLGMEVAELA